MRRFINTSFKGFAFLLILIFVIFQNACTSSLENPDKEEWLSLFDGSGMEDWTPKFAGYELGVNYNNTFVYKDSLLSVRYMEQDSFSGNCEGLFV